MIETIERIKAEVPGMIITTRLNISDIYQGGFGVEQIGEILILPSHYYWLRSLNQGESN